MGGGLSLRGTGSVVDLRTPGRDSTVTVLLPREGSMASQRCGAGSGVVTGTWPRSASPGDPLPVVKVWYQPQPSDDPSLARWADRVLCAAHRMLGRGSNRTTALPAGQFAAVAAFDPYTGRFDWVCADPASALAGWLGRDPVPEDVCTSPAAPRLARRLGQLDGDPGSASLSMDAVPAAAVRPGRERGW